MKVLKKYYERLKENKNYSEAKTELFKYGEHLQEEGWIDDIIEAGFISPDLSTIFYYGRSPYEGQLVQFSAGNKYRELYDRVQENLSKDFMEV